MYTKSCSTMARSSRASWKAFAQYNSCTQHHWYHCASHDVFTLHTEHLVPTHASVTTCDSTSCVRESRTHLCVLSNVRVVNSSGLWQVRTFRQPAQHQDIAAHALYIGILKRLMRNRAMTHMQTHHSKDSAICIAANCPELPTIHNGH